MISVHQEAQFVDLTAVARAVVEVHGAAPCAIVGAARWISGSWRYGYGVAGRLWSQPPPGVAPGVEAPAATRGALFDLASLSKPVTALLLARLARAGAVDRQAPLASVLPLVEGTMTGGATLDLLSAHRAGLEAHRELFVAREAARQPSPEAALLRAAQARRSDCAGAVGSAGYAPVYSDLGYMLLGAGIEACTGCDLDESVRRQVAEPLGLRVGSVRLLRALSEVALERFVPTELVAWRGGVLRGIVHDENAWVLADRGAAGHAGLFGDVDAVVGLGVAVLDVLAGRCDGWLGRDELAPLIGRRPGGSHCAGFDRRSGKTPMSGARFSEETFGHLGFTGTSIWIDPEVELVGVLLTNRVHPSRRSTAIRAARPAAYDALYDAMLRGPCSSA